MSKWLIVFRSLTYHWRMNVAVALGVAAATAVLSGALLVGSSMRGSLKHLTLDRLGRIDDALVGSRFFRREVVDDLASDADFQKHFSAAAPAILFPSGTVSRSSGGSSRRASQVLVVGCDDSFWDLGNGSVRPRRPLERGQIALNEPLAGELGVTVGDEVVLRLPDSNQVPADSPLGRREDTVRGISGLEVVEILPTESLGRFSLAASQVNSRNAYVALETLQGPLDQRGRVNAVFVSRRRLRDPEASDVLAKSLEPALADYGITLRRVRQAFPGGGGEESRVVFDYFNLTTDRLLIESPIETALAEELAAEQAQTVLTYLANSIDKVVEHGEPPQGICYSLISGLDNNAALGPLFDANHSPLAPLEDDQIVLNAWAAEQLDASPGDRIRLTYFAPETAHGVLEERAAEFTLREIVPLVEPVSPYRRNRPAVYDRPPAPTNDPDLTPVVKGVTDQDSISNWDAPFPVDYDRVLPRDDDYWANHRTTPKGFISLAAARRLWGSRFGQATSIRVPVPADLDVGGPAESQFVAALESRLAARLNSQKSSLGFAFQPVKQQGIAASQGTTPFDVLFLSLSFFIIAAALMLVVLLFRLGVEQRAEQIGTVLAVGLRRRSISRMLVAEGLLVAGLGGVLGVAIGIGWAWVILFALQTIWLGAITTPFLTLYVPPGTLLLGYICGVLVSLATIAWSVRRMRRISVRRLLAGQASEESQRVARPGSFTLGVAVLLLAASLGLAYWAPRLGGEAQAGAFVGAGSLVLTALLIFARRLLLSGGRRRGAAGSLGLPSLALSNAGRNPGRSTLTIALMATACFLIISMSAFQMDPSLSGAGGFHYLAESSQPIYADLNSEDVRRELLADDASLLDGGTVLSLRVQAGDDASCNNLYRPNRPRVLGVPEAMVRYFDDPGVQKFEWAAHAGQTPDQQANPWRVLLEGNPDAPIPVVLDKNTAMYSLQLYGGIGEQFSIDQADGSTVRFQVAGLLSNSVFQGVLLIGEQAFLRTYPEVNGHQYFLIKAPGGESPELEQALENRLSDFGYDVTASRRRLADLLAVQNTYLSTFQALGAVGLLLGTFGLATVQIRNVLERRQELALMRAIGFRRRRLVAMVLLENASLLLGGLLTGFLGALVAVLPHMLLGGAKVPLVQLSATLAVVLAVGLVSSLTSVRAMLKALVLSALRNE